MDAQDSPVPSSQVLPWLRSELPRLKGGDAKVIEAILLDPAATVHRSVSEVAEAAATSTATVVRSAQNLGFKGFQDLKLALARELGSLPDEQADDSGDPSLAILRQVTANGAAIVRDAGSLVDPDSFRDAQRVLLAADQVLFLAVGTSAPLALDAAYRFRTVGLRTDAPTDVHMQHVSARLLGPTDVCFAISHSGATREILTGVEAAKSTGASSVAITSYPRSPLTELVDTVLTAGSREVSFHLEAMASRLAHIAVLDALLVAIAAANRDATKSALAVYTDVLTEHRL
jgi:RpiR family carbohydrate utilization transcriptional regulator